MTKVATNKGRVRGLIKILTLAYVATLSTTRDQTSEFIPVGASNITEIVFKEYIFYHMTLRLGVI